MSDQPIRFQDGAAYDRGMGVWSRLAGETFLKWLAPQGGLRWIDVGCGSGAFTELLVETCAPSEVHGVDPSEGQLSFARGRLTERGAIFQLGDAMALPFPDDRADAAVMALVIFFVPEPAKGVAEMARVVRPGGLVAAYAWDMLGGGFPFAPLNDEMRALGILPPSPPNADASRMDALRGLWKGAGLEAVETREITVHRTFVDFDEFWTTSTQTTGSLNPALAAMAPGDLEQFKARLRARLPIDAQGRITYASRANAIKGRVAG
jgi:SAM-dependent methyltransferase